jgi:general secretion pathway protein C
MQALSPERSNLALTAAVPLATLAALALLGAVLAHWTWTWLAPRPEARVESPAEPAAGVAAARRLLGTLQRNPSLAAPTGIAIKLLGGVAATRGRRGYAVLQIEGREILAVAEGKDAAPGIRVAEVHPAHVILSRNGIRESLALPQKKPLAEPAAPRGGTSPSVTPGSP